MATMAALLGGVFGFFSFAGMLLFSDAGFIAALSVYLMVGIGTTTSLICLGMVASRFGSSRAEPRLQPVRVPAGNSRGLPAE